MRLGGALAVIPYHRRFARGRSLQIFFRHAAAG
jgi:hypothetical protein